MKWSCSASPESSTSQRRRFCSPPARPDADWRLRTFTPAGTEVFGAGHNALGAWWWLAETDRLSLDTSPAVFSQEIGDRVLPVEISSDARQLDTIGMKQASPSFGAVHEDLSELTVALGLEEDAFGGDRFPARVVSTGAAHLLVHVRNRAAIERADPDAEQLASLLRAVDGQGCYLFCLDPLDSDATAHARFFNPTVGIREDPATGSAVLLAAADSHYRPWFRRARARTHCVERPRSATVGTGSD